MEQVGDDREQRHLLPAMLGRGRGERAADLAVELARRPQAAGGIAERRHLARHPAEARRRADDDRIVIGERGGAFDHRVRGIGLEPRSEEHTSELQSLMRISYAVFCLKKKKITTKNQKKIKITIKKEEIKNTADRENLRQKYIKQYRIKNT